MTDLASSEKPASATALGTAFLRALAARDPRPERRGPDTLAEYFLDETQQHVVRDPALRLAVRATKLSPGAYEYMVARTAFFDHIVAQALDGNVPQVVWLGAGYDSRPYRFRARVQGTRLFELDAAPTQQRKQACLRQAAIPVPAALRFVPIDFETQDLRATLAAAGFSPDQQTLFVWEGVSYYLSAAAVDQLLASVRAGAPQGSSIGFDYVALSAETLQAKVVKDLRQHLDTQYAAEPRHFGIRAGQIDTWLAERGFAILEHLTAAEMTERYLTLDGHADGQVPPLFSLAHAATQ